MMNLKKLITVIIPTFNRAALVKRAIESVLNQKNINNYSLEIIVVDDGSTDNTMEVLYEFHQKIKILRIENRGPSAARNKGIEVSQGDYICFLDSDDYWLPKKLYKQLATLESCPEYKVIYTDEVWIRNAVRVNQKKIHKKYGGEIYSKCLPLCIISPSSVMIKKEVFDITGAFDENLPACEDYDLWLRITSRFKVYYLDEPLIVKTGGHEDQLSKKYWGMDRFRIQALQKALLLPLSTEQREETMSILRVKAQILEKGCLKRNKLKAATYYKELTNL